MNKCIKHGTWLFILLSFFCLNGFGQERYRQAEGTTIAVNGTSTLHDWALTSVESKISTTLQFTDTGLSRLHQLTVTVPVKSLRSGHAAMDRNTYSAMDADRYPTIVFELQSATITGNVIRCTGQVTIAGVSKKINFDADYKSTPDQILTCRGSINMKMSDFNIDPPSFMFGTVTTGDEIRVSFQINLVAANRS